MAARFPLFIDLHGNNCIIFGGGSRAAHRAEILLQFGAKVTVISPTLCEALREMDKQELIRYIPRRYYRGDCSSGYLCIAATNDEAINIAISDECKAKAIAVNVTKPAAFGTFLFPEVVSRQGIMVTVYSENNPKSTKKVREYLDEHFSEILETALDKDD